MIDLLLAINAVSDVLANIGIYPKAVVDKNNKRTDRTEWQDGWNAAILHFSKKVFKQFDVLKTGIDEDLALLSLIDVGWLVGKKFCLNMNDVFYPGADLEMVSKEEIKEVVKLFNSYGLRGIDYWVFKKRGYPAIERHKEEMQEIRIKEEKKNR